MAEPSSAQKRPKTPSGRNQPSTDRPGANDTSRLSCDPAALAPGAQRRFVTRSSRPSVKHPKMRPRALTKGRRMQRSSAVSPLRGAQLSVSHKLCVECGKMLDSGTGYVNSKSQRTGKLYLNSACRPCHNHRVRVVAKLKRNTHAPPLAHHASVAVEYPSYSWTTPTTQTRFADGSAGSVILRLGLWGTQLKESGRR